MRLYVFLTTLIMLFHESPAGAKNHYNIPLNYRAQKNHIRVFAQRFDYKVNDASHLKVGHTITDLSAFTMTFKTNPENTTDFIIQWPSSLIEEGILVLKDNNGKAIFFKEFTKTEAQFSKREDPTDETVIEEIGSFTIKDQAPEVLEQLSYLPFMVLCVYRIDKNTHINICSDELYLNQQKQPFEIKSRTSKKEQLNIDINGKTVGPQGYIFLTQPDESVFLRAQKNTGANLEIQTQYDPVEFIDVSLKLIKENKFIDITGKGLSPYNEKDNLLKNSKLWKTRIPYSYPIMYLLGGGGIPLRQEFFIKEDPPEETLRLYIDDKSVFKTYNSEIEYRGIKKKDITVTSQNPKNSFSSSANNHFLWKLTDLKKGAETVAELELKTKDRTFYPSTSVYRGYPWSTSINLKTLGPGKRLSAELSLQKWFDHFLGLESSHLKPGFELKFDKYLTAENYEFDFYSVRFKYRMTSTLQYEDSSWGVLIPIGQVQFTTDSTTTLGIGLFFDQPIPRFLSWGGDRISSNIEYHSPLNTDLISGFARVNYNILVSISQQQFLEYGFGLEMIGSETEPQINLGWSLKY